MSMFENKTKPELERGNYLVYTDEPDTIFDSAGGGGGGGGGGVQTLHTHYDSGSEIFVLDTVVTFNELKAAFDAGSAIHLELANESAHFLAVSQMVSYDSYSDEADPLYKASFVYMGSAFDLSANSPDSPLAVP